MNMKKIVKILSLTLAVLMLSGALFACAKDKADTDYSWTAADTDAVTYFSRILPKNAEAREKFVAASRGYNMSEAGFDLSAERPDTGTVHVDGAVAALVLVQPTDDASKQKFNEFCEDIRKNPLLVKEIVQRTSEKVDLEVKNGPIDTLLVWIGKFMQILTKATGGNYVLGLFLFAIVVEVLMLPFGIKQQKNSLKQARLRPKEMAIRNKYKGRRDQATMQKMNQEIQALYQKEGFNPMGGCLPLLIQLPIIMALYQIVIDPLRYVLGKAAGLSQALTTYCTAAKAAGGLGIPVGTGKGTIELLSQAGNNLGGLQNFTYFSNAGECYSNITNVSMPNFTLFGVNTGLIPGFRPPFLLLLIPVLTFVLYFASMKLNRKFMYQPAANDPQMGCSNNIMDITMPLMSVYITFIVPAAVGIYWMFKCVISTLKQFIMHKAMPMPVFTEEDYKAAERELKGKNKTQKKKPGERVTKSGVTVRSLHHIDDDDELPLRTPADKVEAKPQQKATEKSEEPANKPSVPHLKDDRKDNSDN
jgi:YidC/Oxa1 family membrane protein insertase